MVDGDWLADTGFGSGLLEPVPLVDGSVSQQGAWTFRTVRLDDGSWQLHELRDGTWQTHYTIPPETTYLADVEVANFATSHRPTSRFVLQVVVIRKDEDRVRSPDRAPVHRRDPRRARSRTARSATTSWATCSATSGCP